MCRYGSVLPFIDIQMGQIIFKKTKTQLLCYTNIIYWANHNF